MPEHANPKTAVPPTQCPPGTGIPRAPLLELPQSLPHSPLTINGDGAVPGKWFQFFVTAKICQVSVGCKGVGAARLYTLFLKTRSNSLQSK